MKFQDSSFNGLKVTVGTKSVTHPPTHAPKAICPINFFKVGGIKKSGGEGSGEMCTKNGSYCREKEKKLGGGGGGLKEDANEEVKLL